RRRWAVVADIKAWLDASAKGQPEGPAELRGLMAEAQQLRRQLKLGVIDHEHASTVLDLLVDHHLAGYPVDPDTRRPRADPATDETIRTAYAVALHPEALPLSEALRDYSDELRERVRKQTLATREKRLQAFREWLGADLELKAITKAKAGKYVTDVLMRRGLAPKTVRDTLSDLSAFFNWAMGRGMVDYNPFAGLAGTVRTTSRGTKAKTEGKRRPWTEGELSALFRSVGPESQYWTMAVIALYTGMRQNEIAETVVSDVHAAHIYIPEGKTESSVRSVPLHPIIRPLVEHLKETSTDGYLVSGLKRGGADQKRQHYFSKRFGDHLARLSLKGKGVVFHTLRGNMATALEIAGVTENVAQQIVGHKKQSL
ncbi:MAG TPA: tyrosine-type recombinase/integrase, partial [Pseudodesulfovibrio sp.]|nr:tyrosine-type recombinase/integrase [Pseudodesulfovibrio sp.]